MSSTRARPLNQDTDARTRQRISPGSIASLGALLGIWLGLFLTTSPAPWPHGISFAQAGVGPHAVTDGWRWMYAVGALLALIGVLLRLELPESARWLVGKGRFQEAEKVVGDMEKTAASHRPLAPVPEDIPVDQTTPESTCAFGALFENRTYAKRVIQLLASRSWPTSPCSASRPGSPRC
jgi:MFS transporter, putative metabolite:H+ symporter